MKHKKGLVQKHPHYSTEENGPSRQNGHVKCLDYWSDIGLCLSCYSITRAGTVYFSLERF
jgi:hypothetical protein